MSNISSRVKQGKTELGKQKVTFTGVAVATTKLLFGMCTAKSDAGTDDCSLVLGILHEWTHARAIARVSGYGLDRPKRYFY